MMSPCAILKPDTRTDELRSVSSYQARLLRCTVSMGCSPVMDAYAEALMEGQTLILPAHKLSARDKEILAGIGPWSYRTYPVRAGETLDVSPQLLVIPTDPSRLKVTTNPCSPSALQCRACHCAPHRRFSGGKCIAYI